MTMDPRVERLRRLDACAVSDALDKCGLKGVATGIPQLSGASAQFRSSPNIAAFSSTTSETKGTSSQRF